MKILVCIKQVPDPEVAVEPDQENRWIKTHRNVTYKMNRYDEFALEEALRIREANPGTLVHVVTAGPERAAGVIKRAFGMGADKGFHIFNPSEGYVDPFITASQLADFASDKHYDVILTGIMSEDMMQAQTGQLTAELIGLPCATSVISLVIDKKSGRALVKRELEDGESDLVDVSLPAVFTIQSGINTPRYPTLSNILKADTKTMESVNSNPVNPRQQPVQVLRPEKQRSGIRLEGSIEEKAEELVSILKRRGVVLR